MSLVASKPVFPLYLWPVAEALAVLAIATKPSPYRKLFFIPIAAIVIWAITSTRIIMDKPPSEMGVGARLFAVLMHSSTWILLSEPQLEVRSNEDEQLLAAAKKRDDDHQSHHSSEMTDGKHSSSETLKEYYVPIPARPFRARLWWALQLWLNPRGVGWTFCPTPSIIHQPKALNYSRRRFILYQLSQILFLLFLFDLNGVINSVNPYYKTLPAVDVPPLQQLWKLYSCGYAFGLMLMLEIQNQLASVICLSLGFTKPSDWPPLFGRIGESYTLKRFWSKTWHALFRWSFIKHTNLLVETLRITNKATARLVTLFLAFFLSGLLHYVADYVMMHDARKIHALVFFCLQPLALIFEDLVIKLGSRVFGITKPNILLYLLGYAWVFTWCAISLPIWSDEHLRYGYRDDMPRNSLILGLWKGKWEWD